MFIYRNISHFTSHMLFFFLVSLKTISAQNIVFSDFDKLECQPENRFLQKIISKQKPECILPHWQSATEGTPYLEKVDGDNCLHITFFDFEKTKDGLRNIYLEYVQAELLEKLEEGIYYRLKMKLRLAPGSTLALSGLGAYFSEKKLPENISAHLPLPNNPQIKFEYILKPPVQFDYFSEWVELEAYFKANGNERFMVLGYFYTVYKLPGMPDKKLNWSQWTNVSGKVFGQDNPKKSKYWIKDILLEKMARPLEKEMNRLSNGEAIVLNNILFETGSAELQKASYIELEKWAEKIKESQNAFEISGHTDNMGNDELNMELSKKRAEAVRQYLIKNGVEENKLTAIGYGETRPLVENNDLGGHHLNRRVELKLLD